MLTWTIISLGNCYDQGDKGMRSCCYEYNLYSVTTKTWKTVGNAFSDNYGYRFGYAAVNIALYWTLMPKQLEEEHGSSTCIFSFDKEVYVKVVELGGCVCIISEYLKLARRFDFWVMKEKDGKSIGRSCSRWTHTMVELRLNLLV